jgi:hypothetical protein
VFEYEPPLSTLRDGLRNCKKIIKSYINYLQESHGGEGREVETDNGLPTNLEKERLYFRGELAG